MYSLIGDAHKTLSHLWSPSQKNDTSLMTRKYQTNQTCGKFYKVSEQQAVPFKDDKAMNSLKRLREQW